MITPEEVKLAYKFFLAREPESDEVVASYCQALQTLNGLTDEFISSPEFLRRISHLLEKSVNSHRRYALDLPKIPVETGASHEELDQMFRRIKGQWVSLGDVEPYWSVITQPQNLLVEFDKNKEQFYVSGKAAYNNFVGTLRRNDITLANLETCLEFGCGVGRVTEYLARSFNKVVATDISEKHIDIAKQHLTDAGIENVELFSYSNLHEYEKLPVVDAIFSTITLQHNPPPLMVNIISRLFISLSKGGIAYLQIPSYKSGYLFEVNRYLASKELNPLEVHFLPQSEVFSLIEKFDCRCLEVREEGSLGYESDTISNVYLIQKC